MDRSYSVRPTIATRTSLVRLVMVLADRGSVVVIVDMAPPKLVLPLPAVPEVSTGTFEAHQDDP